MAEEERGLIPVYGFLQGDTLGLLLLARGDDTLGALAEQLCASAAVRVRTTGAVDVIHRGRRLDLQATVASAGVAPLDRIDVVPGAGR